MVVKAKQKVSVDFDVAEGPSTLESSLGNAVARVGSGFQLQVHVTGSSSKVVADSHDAVFTEESMFLE